VTSPRWVPKTERITVHCCIRGTTPRSSPASFPTRVLWKSESVMLIATLLDAPNECVGFYGTGVFNQTGRTNTATNIYLGYYDYPGSGGTYNLEGGSLSAVSEYVGVYGSGLFNQSGGSNNIGNYLLIGYAGLPGKYNLSGRGSPSAPTEFVGYSSTGTFNHSGGTNSVSGLR
jgi:hypothetical protein